MNKELIHKRFGKNLDNYNKNAKIQMIMAEKLFNYINNKKPVSVLEIGCGTGFLTKIAAKNLDFEKYTAVDIVEECESYISEIDKKISFYPCDIEDLLKDSQEKFDLIISNASLQWVDDFEKVVKALQSRLNRHGELVFSTFGKENFREIYYVLGTSLKYYSTAELQELFPQCEIYSEIHIMAFKNPKEVLKHLRLTGVNAIEHKIWTRGDLMKFENGYKNICATRPTLTYNPVYVRITG